MNDRLLLSVVAAGGALCGVLAALSLPDWAFVVLLVLAHFAALRLYRLEHRAPSPESD